MVTKKHSIEFKLSAVKAAEQPGVYAQDIADAIGIHAFSLSRWKKELREAGYLNVKNRETKKVEQLSLEQRVSDLEKEVMRLRMENDLLKKLEAIDTTANGVDSKPSKS